MKQEDTTITVHKNKKGLIKSPPLSESLAANCSKLFFLTLNFVLQHLSFPFLSCLVLSHPFFHSMTALGVTLQLDASIHRVQCIG